MCFSFNSGENREAFRQDENGYCDKFNLTAEQRRAIKERDVLRLLEVGGNIYYLAKWAGIFGLNVQQIGAQQRGMTEEQFQEMLVDHAFTVPMALLWPGKDRRAVRTVPVSVNTVQIPLPTPARCFKLGQAIGRALESFPEDRRVVILGTGGLSHQLDGTRA